MRGDLSIFRWNLVFLSLPVCLCLIAVPARAVDLPEKAPIPKERPAQKPEPAAKNNSGKDEPAKDTRPAPDEAEKSAPASERTEPDEKVRPAEPGEDGNRETEPAKEPDIPPPLSPAGQLCRDNLRSLGVLFTEDDPVDSDEGCAIPHPLSITTLSRDIAIKPAAELNCMMAETFAAFMRDVVQPAAERHFDKKVKAIRHASAFVCRPRNGTKTLSEHAFGNALDIAAFILDDGSEVAVKAYDPKDHASLDKAQFLNEVRAAACGPFTTVLGPGSNADHATHFHFDLKERNNRYKVCE